MRRALAALIAVALTVPLVLFVGDPVAALPSFTARGSVNQVSTDGHAVGATVELLGSGGVPLASGVADAQGAYLFKKVAKGTGYQVRDTGVTVSGLTVTDPTDNPPPSFYAGTPALAAGFGYLTTRDGTKLSVNVTMPNDGSTGPWPVVFNYSGYDPSQPGGAPSEAAVYPFQGYVTVGVNMRGTGCSGGAFDFMEALQSTDGYDVVETLARQSWSNGNVGMVGISYSGFSQLFVAATQPPHLRAITPSSPFADTYTGILYPGGILNDGFAVGWATEREAAAKPLAHQWTKDRVAGGDTTCAQNQVMRLQSRPLLADINANPFATPDLAYLNIKTFVHKIKVPTLLASQWQDEQTGGSAAQLLPLFAPEAKARGDFTNGTHVEPESPTGQVEAMNFIDLYVGKRIPHMSPVLRAGAPAVLAGLFGSSDTAAFALPPDTWGSEPSYLSALLHYQARPKIQIRWENGTVAGKEGLPLAPTATRFSQWPPAGLVAEKLYFGPDGKLTTTVPTLPDNAVRAWSQYRYDPTSKRNVMFDGSTSAAWGPHPDVHWNTLVEGKSLSFLSDPYAKRAAYAGSGSVDLWLASTAADTDLEATLTEVRPDGKEVLIQSGWLRASHRKEDLAKSTELVPVHTHLQADAAPLPAQTFSKVRVELFPFAHVIRPGSRLRVNIEAPGGNQDFWSFQTLAGGATNRVGHSLGMPSRVVLPRLPDAQVPNVPAARPPCTLAGVTTQAVSLRNQPCRAYLPGRIPTAVSAALSTTGVTVGWVPPSGPAPTSYRVTPRGLGYRGTAVGSPAPVPPPVTVPGNKVSTTFTQLPVGVGFAFTVEAIYGTTASPISDASRALVDPGLTAPSFVRGTAKTRSVALKWNAAVPRNGGSAVTGYRVTPIVAGVAQAPRTFGSAATALEITGLTTGCPYTFVVSAINARGTGAASGPS
ncbi:MAG: putative hydrolase, CocE/NonD family, partial [Acidimicrobiales bacterium]|nr:putative hydrolase, CocE/NonD family [Acidimicrobiales bacterium]